MMMLAINVIIIMMTKSIVHLFSCIANMYRLNKEIIRNQLVVMKQTYTYMLMLMYCQEGKGISNKEIITPKCSTRNYCCKKYVCVA